MQNKLLVDGYIHEIQSLLDANKIIPSSLFVLCYTFIQKKCIFIAEGNEFLRVSLFENTVQRIVPKIAFQNNTICDTFGYIPRISVQFAEEILSPNKIYHGIISQILDNNGNYFHYIFVFESSDKDLVHYDIFQSKKTHRSPVYEYIHCGDRDKIFSKNKDSNHWNAVCLDSDKFTHLNIKTDINKWRWRQRRGTFCIPKRSVFMKDKIWWIELYDVSFMKYCGMTYEYGIYDPNTTQSTMLGTLRDSFNNDDGACLCYNDESNEIFISSTTKKEIKKYNLNTNKWSTIPTNDYISFLWMDGIRENTLYSAYINNDAVSFKYLYSSSDNGSEWKEFPTDIIVGASGTFFC